MIIYFDLDGVLADFNGRIEKLSGAQRADLTVHQLWEIVNSDPNFFSELDPLPLVHHVKELCEFSTIEIRVLTATGNKYSNVAPQKMSWVKKHLGIHPSKVNIVKSGKDKQNWASPDSILIDDTIEVIQSWEGNGGIGLHYSPERHNGVIEQISRLVQQKS